MARNSLRHTKDRKRKIACLLLTFSLLLNVGTPVSAQLSDGALSNDNQSAVQPDEDAPLSPDIPLENLDPDDVALDGSDSGAVPDEEGVEDSGNQPANPSETPADAKQFSIASVSALTNPSPLTSSGGSVTFVVNGSYLTKENIWIKLEKSGQLFQIVPVKKSGFVDTILGAVLPSSNIATLKSDSVILPPATEETMFVYSVSLYHSESSTPPDANSELWKNCGVAPLEVPRVGDKPSSDTDDTQNKPASKPDDSVTIGSSETPDNNTPSGDDTAPVEPSIPDDSTNGTPSPDTPDEDDVPVGGLPDSYPDDSDIPLVPGESETVPPENDDPSAPSEDPENPDVPALPAQITGAEIQTIPSPLTAEGGFAIVNVTGSQLDAGTVWVRIISTAPDFTTNVWKAGSAKTPASASTDKILLPVNTLQEDCIYSVSAIVKNGSTAPDPFEAGWIDVSTITVPKAETPVSDDDSTSDSDTSTPSDPGKLEITSVQATTVPDPLTSAGGSVYISAAGSNLEQSKLWVKLDNGSKTIIQKFKDSAPTVASSQQINLPANESNQDITYEVSVMSSDSISKPRDSDSGWQKYPDAAFVVPKIADEILPEIHSVSWNPQVSEKEIVTQFTVSGSNLDKGENSVWIKAVPDGSATGTKIFAANQAVSESSAQTEVVSLKQKKLPGSDRFAEYKIFALAKTSSKKPSANDGDWQEFSMDSLASQPALMSLEEKSEEEKQPVITNTSIYPSTLPSSGGEVTVTLSGENVEGQKVYIASEGNGDPITKLAKFDNTGVASVSFKIPANNTEIETARYTAKYQLLEDSIWRSLGSITVGQNIEMTVQKQDTEHNNVSQFDSSGGFVVCSFTNNAANSASLYSEGDGETGDSADDESGGSGNDETDGSGGGGTDPTPTPPPTPAPVDVQVRIGQNGTPVSVSVPAGSTASTDPLEIPANTGTNVVEHAIQVSTDGRTWAVKATVSVPTGQRQPVITEYSAEAGELTKDGGEVTVEFTGENLNAENVSVFARLNTGVAKDDQPTGKATVSEDGTTATVTLKIPANANTFEKTYKLYYQAILAENPVETSWILARDSFTIPGQEETTIIESVKIEVLPDYFPLTAGGGYAKATLKGTNFKADGALLHLNLRCLGDAKDMMLKIESQNTTDTEATIEFEIPANTSPLDQVYEVYASVGSQDDVTNNASAWKKFGAFTVPSTSGVRVTNVTPSTSSNTIPSNSAITLDVTGTNLDRGSVWLRLKPNDGSSTKIMEASEIINSNKLSTISFLIGPNLSSTSDLIYTVDTVIQKSGTSSTAVYDSLFDTSSVYQFEITVPANQTTAPSYSVNSSSTQLSSDGGDVTITLNGTNLNQADIYVSINEAGFTPVKVESGDGATGTATLTLPPNRSMGMDNVYTIYTTALATGSKESADPYPTGSWIPTNVQITVERKKDTSATDAPYIETWSYSPADVSTVSPITFTFSGENFGSNLTRVWLYQSTEHTNPLALTRDATTLKKSWTEASINVVPGSGNDTATVTVTPYEGMNCFSVYISPDGRNPGSMALTDLVNDYGSHHLVDLNLKAAASSDNSVQVVRYESTIPPGAAYQTLVELKKLYFPTDNTRNNYLIRAVTKGTNDDVKAPAKNLINFRSDSTKASALLEFPADSLVAGSEFMLQISSDGGNNYTNLNAIVTVSTALTAAPDEGTDPTPTPDPDPDPTPDPDPGPDIGDSDDNNNNDNDNNNNDNSNSNNGSWYNQITAGDLEAAAKQAEYDGESVVTINGKSGDTYITSGFFYAAEYYKKDIVIDCGKYSWTIKAGTRIARDLDLWYNLGIDFSGKNYETNMQQMAGYDATILPFYIKYHGVLPANMVLTISSDFRGGDYAYVYRYNENSNDVTHIAQPRVSTRNGNVIFNMDRCSYYFISNKAVHSKYERVLYDSLGQRVQDEDYIDEEYINTSSRRSDVVEEDVNPTTPGGKVNPNTGA